MTRSIHRSLESSSQFLGRSVLPSELADVCFPPVGFIGRVCLGCGAITCEAQRVGKNVVWSKFGFETGITEFPPDFETYENIGPFAFEAGQYADAIREAAVGKL